MDNSNKVRRVAIVGSRSFNDYPLLKECINEMHQEKSITEIISGGARGADALAERYAKEHGIPLTVYVPDWKHQGRGAGIQRNADIVAACDEVVAFWDGQSPGTRNTINRAHSASKNVRIVRL